jgi:hypothetical protein
MRLLYLLFFVFEQTTELIFGKANISHPKHLKKAFNECNDRFKYDFLLPRCESNYEAFYYNEAKAKTKH